MTGAVRLVVAEIHKVRARTEHLGQGGQDRAHLGVAVLGRLDDGCVEAEGHVVHEHPAVHLTEIHRPFDRLAEGLKHADNIVPIDAEIQRQMVPGAGGHDDHRDAAYRHDIGDERLGSVTTGHADHIGAGLNRLVGQIAQIVTRLQHHWLTPRRRHSSTSWKRSAFPPPDFRFMISTP